MIRKIKFPTLILMFLNVAINAQTNYLPSSQYLGDIENRVGHSNSTPPDNFGGSMNSPSEIIQIGSNIVIAGSSGTDLGNFFIHKKNALNGSNIQMVFVNLGPLIGLPVGVNNLKGMEYDPNTDRLYLYGSSSLPGYSGFIICYNQSTLTIDTSFDNDGIQMFSSEIVVDIVVPDFQHILVLLNDNTGFGILELLNAGQWSAYIAINDNNKVFSARRIKLYPSKANRFYIVGKINTGTEFIPAIWGVDRVKISKSLNSFQIFTTNNQSLGSEGVGEFEDLCFPFNSSTGICDIVTVGNSSIGTVNTGWTPESTGIYIKYKGNLNTIPYNISIDNSFKNQFLLPGKGIANNLPLPNKTYFTRCEMVGNNVMVLGAFENNHATVGFINSSGSTYTRVYVAPNSTIGNMDWVHMPRGFFINSQNHIFLSGCDTANGLTSIKLIPN